MKNIEVLYTPEEISHKINGLWKTDLFKRESERKGSVINQVIERAAQYPLFFHDISDIPGKDTPDNEKTEWSQHPAWFGGIARRKYENPAIADLSLLHELYHKGMMTYEKDMSFEAFKRKMFDNELEASVTSELEIYFDHPELRKHTFKQEIFADRFLNDKEFMQRWKNNRDTMRANIREKRRNAMYQGSERDKVQYWISKFSLQNDAFVNTWATRYNNVETAMSDLHRAIDMGEDRKAAMDKYMTWLRSSEVTQGTEISFPDEARAFSGIYLLDKKHYAESMAKGELNHVISHNNRTFTGSDPKELLAGPVAESVLGPLPHYSNRTTHHIHNCTTTTAGAFIAAYAKDSIQREPVVVMIERSEKDADGRPKVGLLGGYINLDYVVKNGAKDNSRGEQPKEGALREFGEELIKGDGRTVISPDISRLNYLISGIDYRREVNPACSYTGFSLTLKPEELQAIKAHAQKMHDDPAYAKAAKEASGGEVANVIITPLSKAIAMTRERFTHPHEFDAIVNLSEQLKQQQAGPKR